MSELLNVTAICVGFVAAVCFCIGSATSGVKAITFMAATYWDFNESLARALAAQQAQYAVGALLLVVSFALQAAAVLASQSTPQAHPQWLPHGACLFLSVLVPTTLLAWLAVRYLGTSTTNKVLRILRDKAKQ